MILVICFFTVLIVAAVYLMYVEHKAKKEPLYKVECGPKERANQGTYEGISQKIFTPWDVIRNNQNKIIDRSKYKMVEVDGNCMVPFDIHNGDVLLYEPITSETELREGKLVVIQIEENNNTIRKIRAINKILPEDVSGENDILETYYFIHKGDTWFRRRSSKNHKPEQVLGIVQHKLVAA